MGWGRRREGKDGVNTAVIGKFWFQAEKPNKLDQKKKKKTLFFTNFVLFVINYLCFFFFICFNGQRRKSADKEYN